MQRGTITESTRASPPKSSNTGALYTRWKKLQYTTSTPGVGGVNEIQPWANAGIALNGSASAAASHSTTSTGKRRRNGSS